MMSSRVSFFHRSLKDALHMSQGLATVRTARPAEASAKGPLCSGPTVTRPCGVPRMESFGLRIHVNSLNLHGLSVNGARAQFTLSEFD